MRAGYAEPMIRMVSNCGLRLGELMPLERADWHGETIEIRRTLHEGSVVQGTKTDHGVASASQVVPVPPDRGRIGVASGSDYAA